MRNDDEELPADPISTMLDRLDSTEEFGVPDETPPPTPALNRRELDVLVEQIVDEELQRINGRKG